MQIPPIGCVILSTVELYGFWQNVMDKIIVDTEQHLNRFFSTNLFETLRKLAYFVTNFKAREKSAEVRWPYIHINFQLWTETNGNRNNSNHETLIYPFMAACDNRMVFFHLFNLFSSLFDASAWRKAEHSATTRFCQCFCCCLNRNLHSARGMKRDFFVWNRSY